MSRRRPAFCGIAIALLAACGDSSSGGQCPSGLPAACPSAAPSYQSDIAPIIQSRCLACHGPGGVEYSRPLDTYSAVYSQRSPVLNQVYGCLMPPVGAPAPTEAERQLLLAWLVCKAPNN
jgi:uncharacterized membrane protein